MHLVRCAIAALAVSVTGCADPHILVGTDLPDRSCADAGSDAAPVAPATLMFWSTGFESGGFNDWSQPPNAGFCYIQSGASYKTVTSPLPVHSGQYAAAFTVNTDTGSPSHSRCLRQGLLPQSAYYSAWYYVPVVATNINNWNLLHFQGSNVANGNCILELWDVSLTNDGDGGLTTSVYDFLRQRSLPAASIPIGQWFRLEVFLRRAADNTGEFTLYQDGKPVLPLKGLVTDDSFWGQWFVGNFATALSPGMSTVYVDDVSISANGP